jgi:hypothetical protein
MIKWRWWVIWLVVTLGFFFALEIPAILNEVKGDTFSEYVWAMSMWWRGLITAAAAWLFLHFGWKI